MVVRFCNLANLSPNAYVADLRHIMCIDGEHNM